VIVRRDFFIGITGDAIGGGAAAGAVDGGAGFAQGESDAASETPRGAGDEGDAVFEIGWVVDGRRSIHEKPRGIEEIINGRL
jgi:hypothetical protein